MLLTTGTQFEADADPGFAADYVRRLRETGIAALGFGTEVIRAGTPDALVDACARQGLPLFEVPYRVPFIAIARLVADLLAEDAYARQAWALAAQRAISLAALRPDGLSATLGELSHRIGAWVGLVDASGTARPRGARGRTRPARARRGRGRGAVDAPPRAAGEPHAHRRRVRRHARSASPCRRSARGGALRGVLAIGDSAELDQAGREVVTSVIALAGLALEQNRDLDRARGHLRSGLLRGILAGDTELAERVAAEMWGPLPTAPLRVAVTDAPAAARRPPHRAARAPRRGTRRTALLRPRR